MLLLELLLAILILPLLLTLPGLAVYGLLVGRLGRLDAMPMLTSLGLSLALWPILLLYSTRLGLVAGAWWVAAVLAGSGLLIWRGRRELRRVLRAPDGATLLLGGLFLLVLAIRLYTIRDLLTPLYGDSVHHTIITQLILDRGGIPDDYQPYIPLTSFTYHFGFHTWAALVAWVSGLTATKAVLLVGQVISALTVLAAYYLAAGLFAGAQWGRWAGLVAALVTGLGMSVPAAYTNWGRYTQLMGQAILPFALLALVVALRDYRGWRQGWPLVLLNVVLITGLFFSHYRVLIFYVAFASVFWILDFGFWKERLDKPRGAGLLVGGTPSPEALGLSAGAQLVRRPLPQARKQSKIQNLKSKISVSVLIAFGALLLGFPWLLNLVQNYFGGLANRLGSVSEDYLRSYNAGDFLGTLDLWLRLVVGTAVVVAGGLLLAGWRRPERNLHLTALVVAGWITVLYIVANPRSFGLPGAGAVNNFAVSIMLYIPASLLVGYVVGYAINLLYLTEGRKQSPTEGRVHLHTLLAVAFALLTLTLGWLAPRNPDTSNAYVVQAADLVAINWLAANTEPSDKVLVAAVPASEFASQAVVGVDAGSWIAPLARREVSVPTLVAGSERAADPQLQQHVRDLTLAAWPLMNKPTLYQSQQPNSDPTAATYATLQAAGITHIYASANSGFWKLDYFKQHRDRFQKIYDTDGARVYKIVYLPATLRAT